MTRGRVIALVGGLVAVIAVLLWWRSGSSDEGAAGPGSATGDDLAARDDSASGPRRSVGGGRRNPAAEVEGAVRVDGQVVDTTGAAVEGIDVVFAHKVDEIVTSGADGEFSITLPVGSYEVRATGERRYAAAQTVEVTATTPPVVVTVAELARGRGWVIDASGAPVPGAVVIAKIGLARQPAVDKDGVLTGVTTDANGVFEVDLLPGYNRILADHPTLGHGRLALKEVAAGDAEEDLRIQLAPYAVLRGVVRSPDGVAQGGATVSATVQATAVRRSITTTTRDDGSFVLAELVPGTVTLDATQAGLGPADPQKLELEAGVTPPEVTLTLNLPRTLTGRVVDASGEPVYDAKVKVQRLESHVTFHSARTDVDGAFEVSGLDDGPHLITVLVAKRARLSKELSQLPETLDLVLDP